MIRYKEHSKVTTYADFHVYKNSRHCLHVKGMELAWKNNQVGVSRIPSGKYLMKLEYSPAFKKYLYELKLVPGRGEIKIHVANYYKELKGCIAIGMETKDINADGVDDLIQSNDAFDEFMKVMQSAPNAYITIVDLFTI